MLLSFMSLSPFPKKSLRKVMTPGSFCSLCTEDMNMTKKSQGKVRERNSTKPASCVSGMAKSTGSNPGEKKAQKIGPGALKIDDRSFVGEFSLAVSYTSYNLILVCVLSS